MAKYATALNAVDPLFTVEENHLLSADIRVDADLKNRGINPADVSLPNTLLTELAANYACMIAAGKAAQDKDSPLSDKVKHYERQADRLSKTLSRGALGMAIASGSGFGNVILGRG